MKKSIFLVFTILMSMIFSGAIVLGQSPAQIQQQLYIFRDVLGPGAKVGVLCNILNHQRELKSLTVLSKAYKIPIYFYNVTKLTDLNKGVDLLVQSKHINAVLVLPKDIASTTNSVKFLVRKCSEKKLMLLSADPSAVSNGAMLSVISEGGGLKLFVNKKTATLAGFSVPSAYQTKVKYF